MTPDSRTPPRLRLYHSMYQLFSFTMLLALTTNNLGLVWVAMEAATLSTVLLVSVYRTAASLEAAWKYFILCGVGIAQALFGTVLLYMAAERVLGPEGGALLFATWMLTNRLRHRPPSRWRWAPRCRSVSHASRTRCCCPRCGPISAGTTSPPGR